MLAGGGSLQLVGLTQMQSALSAPHVSMQDLRQAKERLSPWLSHVATSGNGRSVDAVKRDMLQVLSDLIALQAAAA
jgi:hypothetical protein